ncbi:MAG TPA: HNH endonuclease signature motif containing protein [Verrucomicrobiae bacterium]|nr:HNH endonuclease signature motif containing protein [Verrucomicrobiae bacterium]
MKGTELVSEILMSLHQGGIINKKTSLDRAIGNEGINGNTLGKLSREFTGTLNRIKRMFPNIHETRFTNTVDFYTLFLLIWHFGNKGYILTDRRCNAIAERLLRKLSAGVDELRQAAREGRPMRHINKLCQDYLPTVLGDTDSAATRERRATIVSGLLAPLFDFKHGKRAFSPEQRRVLWNRDERPLCRICHKPISWEDLTIDHIKAWSRGGATTLANAQIAHHHCNSRKGAR